MAQDASKTAPDGPGAAQEGLYDGPRSLREPCQEVPKKQESYITLKFLSIVNSPTLQNDPMSPQDRR
eukprot:5254468-Pyramimonas_sp.AAC.1